MSQVRTDAATPQAQAGPPGAIRARPLSPHLQVWRWHVTMAASIATRTAGFVLYFALLVAAYLLVSLAGGRASYDAALAVLGSPFGKVALFGITTALFFYLASGVRHLVWDSGHGFEPRFASLTGLACFVFAVVAAVATWTVAVLTGAA